MSAARGTLGCFGAGRLARALLPRWRGAGWAIGHVASRTGPSAARLARSVGAASTRDPGRLIEGSDVVLLAVPDDRLAALVQRLADAPGWRGRTALHVSGVHGPETLAPLAEAGAAVGVLHPLLVMPRRAAAAFPAGAVARCEGDGRAAAVARRLARDAGLRPLPATRRWTPRHRADYHTAASLAANDAVALLVSAAELLRPAGFSRAEALRMLLPLVRSALDELERERDGGAVAGPVARGDAGTLALHLERLQRRDPAMARVHRALARRLLEIARRSGRPSASDARRLAELLRGGPGADPAV